MNLNLIIVAIVAFAATGFALSPRQDAQGTGTVAASASSSASLSAAVSSASASGLAGGDLNQSVDLSIDGKIFPPAIFATSVIPQDFSVNCINCTVNGNISVSGGGGVGVEKIEPPAIFLNAGANGSFDFDDIWVGAIVDSLTAHFEVAINLTASNNTNELIVPLYSLSKSQSFGGITVTATFSPELHGWVNTTTDVNFTHGFDFQMQPDSGLLIPIAHLSQTLTYNLNQSTLTPLPYTATTGDMNMNFELSFRPKFDFLIDVLDFKELGGELSTYFDVPKLDLQVMQVHNVSSSCDPTPLTLPADQVFKNLTNVIPSIGFDVSAIFSAEEIVAKQSSPDFEASWTAKNFSTACLAFNAAAQTLGPASQAKPSELTGSATNAQAPVAGTLLAMVMAIFTVL